jgi:transcriptional regulator with XRE-family HTH domain
LSPLRKARINKGWTMEEVVRRLAVAGVVLDTGNLSRIERGVQKPSVAIAEHLARVLGKKSINEMQILYPERYKAKATA